MHREDVESPGYRERRRELLAQRRQAAAHPNGLDPLCPDFTVEDCDEALQELEREIN